jgi:hypothetical protein
LHIADARLECRFEVEVNYLCLRPGKRKGKRDEKRRNKKGKEKERKENESGPAPSAIFGREKLISDYQII